MLEYVVYAGLVARAVHDFDLPLELAQRYAVCCAFMFTWKDNPYTPRLH